jgi:Transglutaminase-like superfamily
MRQIRRFVRLSRPERRLLAVASIRLAIVVLALRWLGFRWIIGRIPCAQPRTVGAVDMIRARRYAGWIETTQRHLPIKALCLAQSLTLHWWLCSEGIPSELRIGVAKQGRELGAHAWVELNGAPVNGTMAEVAPFTPLEGAGSGRIDTYWRDHGRTASRHRPTPRAEHHSMAMGYRR